MDDQLDIPLGGVEDIRLSAGRIPCARLGEAQFVRGHEARDFAQNLSFSWATSEKESRPRPFAKELRLE